MDAEVFGFPAETLVSETWRRGCIGVVTSPTTTGLGTIGGGYATGFDGRCGATCSAAARERLRHQEVGDRVRRQGEGRDRPAVHRGRSEEGRRDPAGRRERRQGGYPAEERGGNAHPDDGDGQGSQGPGGQRLQQGRRYEQPA